MPRSPSRPTATGSSEDEDEVVLMDHLVVVGRLEGLARLVGPEPPDPAGLGGRIVGQAAGEFLAVVVADPDDVALVELADDVDDPDREEAPRPGFERVPRAGVHDVVPPRPRGQADPSLASRLRRSPRQEER